MKIVLAFGRFQPPTIGHTLLIEKTINTAKEHAADYSIYVSKTQDYKNNPLSVEQKIKYLSLMFPTVKFTACTDAVRTFVETAKYLNNYYDELIMVAGSDRVSAFEKVLHSYNGKDFSYRSIDVISSGMRDNDAADASGMSGTKMRKFAVKNQFEDFYQGIPNNIGRETGLALMNDIKLGLLKTVRKRAKCYYDNC
jgi:hypothetical protein